MQYLIAQIHGYIPFTVLWKNGYLDLCIFTIFQSGETALWYASLKGHMEVVQLLLQKNANVSLCNKVYNANVLVCINEPVS